MIEGLVCSLLRHDIQRHKTHIILHLINTKLQLDINNTFAQCYETF